MAKVVITVPTAGGSPIEIEHNELDGLQGIGPDFYHLNESQYDRLTTLIYENNITTLSNSPTTGERGLNTTVTVSYNIQSKDDIITAASINQGIGSIIENVDQGNFAIPISNLVNNTTFTLSLDKIINGVPLSETKTSTYITYIPQWSGVSGTANLNESNYAGIASSGLTKVVQSDDTINRSLQPSNQYIWFVSTNANATITNNGFPVSIGLWNNTTTFVIKQTVTFTLANGVTTASLTFYRTRELISLVSPQTFIIT